ncbi:nuclear transport factor 2 family protein [Hippea jasoniae]|uniref:DUF4878 domain-containing protein n=1 Tax=Hippea jasoniae TaxID=944479 RepID=UPI0005513330|nr:DUF4878 domain-containing protein [Hippea jasoniae]
MRKFLKFVGIFIVLVVVSFAVVVFLTKDIAEVADNFFASIKHGNYTQAETYLSKGFKSNVSMDKLKHFFPYERFKNFDTASWTSREKDASGVAKLKGSLKFSDGSVMPVRITLVKENDSWKINYIYFPKGGIETSNNNQQNQQDVNFASMVKETTMLFAEAVQTKDYTKLYNHLSVLVKKTATKQQLRNAFKAFEGVNINWNDIKNLRPVITKQYKSTKGVEIVEGYFNTSPSKLKYKLGYYKHNGNWELVSIFYKID